MHATFPKLNGGLCLGILISLLLHAAIMKSQTIQHPAEVEIQSGKVSVELTLMPSIASIATPTAPKPVKETKPPTEVAPEEKSVKEAPLIPVKENAEHPVLPIQDTTEKTEPIEKKEAAESLPEPPLELVQVSEPEPSVNSIEQDGSLETQKGVIADAQTQAPCIPIYPRMSRRRGEEGIVILSVKIDKNGRPSTIQVTQSSGFPRLDKAAITALKKATFHPALRFGKPISSTLMQTFNFTLSND